MQYKILPDSEWRLCISSDITEACTVFHDAYIESPEANDLGLEADSAVIQSISYKVDKGVLKHQKAITIIKDDYCIPQVDNAYDYAYWGEFPTTKKQIVKIIDRLLADRKKEIASAIPFSKAIGLVKKTDTFKTGPTPADIAAFINESDQDDEDYED